MISVITKAKYRYNLNTILEDLTILYDENYIYAVLMEKQVDLYQAEINDNTIQEFYPNEVCSICINLLKQYLKGEKVDFTKCNSKIIGTAFQKKVLDKLQSIQYGSTMSYKEFASKFFNVRQVRAIANQIAKNPLLIIIPCHRVIGSKGDLRGYSGGINNKKQLLELEKLAWKIS